MRAHGRLRVSRQLVDEEGADALVSVVGDDAEGPFTKRFDVDLQGYS